MYATDSVFRIRKVNNYLEDILKNNRLYLASPTSFNDPFDASIAPIVEIDDEDYKKWYELQLEKNKNLSEEQKQRSLNMLETGEYKTERFKEGVIDGWKQGLKEYGICSFSQNISNILLWSHYGDNHRGVAVGIEVQLLESAEHSLTEVHYSSQYPNVLLHDLENYQEILRRKYLCWEYEKEVRIVKNSGANTYFDLPQNAIKQIVFGMNCPDDDFLKVFNWVNWEKMNPDILQAKQRKGKYELGFVERVKKREIESSTS